MESTSFSFRPFVEMGSFLWAKPGTESEMDAGKLRAILILRRVAPIKGELDEGKHSFIARRFNILLIYLILRGGMFANFGSFSFDGRRDLHGYRAI